MQLEPANPFQESLQSHPINIPNPHLESTNPLQESIEPFPIGEISKKFPIGPTGDISDIIVEVPDGSEEEMFDTKIDDIDYDSEIDGWFSIGWTLL